MERARSESNFSTRAISEMVSLALQFEEDERFYGRLRTVLDQISVEAPFPLIITDTYGRPTFWKVTGYPSYLDYGFENLKAFDIHDPPDASVAQLMEMAHGFRDQGQSVRFFYPQSPTRVQGYVCFGTSDLADRLGSAIVLQLLMLLFFFLLGILLYFLVKRYEQESIWVGLARETAHQMGTPLTSLLGWIQLSQARLESDDEGEPLRGPMEEALTEMNGDVERLQKVSARFNNIGGSPALKRTDMRPIVERTVAYFRRRLPHHRVQVEIREQYDEVPMVRIHAELIEWVVENLIKNSLDSIDKDLGIITLSLSYNGTERSVDLHVRDNGRGMGPSVRRKVFRPGYSSKKGGWGLGLTLARRVVEEYHNGRLRLLDTHEGHGSCFVVRLPV
jgi:signal transduction histidine kinase